MDEYTLGWQISERESASGITVNDANGKSIARIPSRPDDLDIGRLIAAAPELFAALENFVTRYPSNPGANQARAALAKARGD